MSQFQFVNRHVGPRKEEADTMLKKLGVSSLDELIVQAVPDSIRMDRPLNLTDGMTEDVFLKHIWKLASKNKVLKTYIGMGYYGTLTPSVIIRNVLENPVWYTSYTPYQAEISQGRLEALLNFQTMITELTAMDIANASLLDEATAMAEAMIMMYNTRSRSQVKANINTCLADEAIWPQTRAVIETRALGLGIDLEFVASDQMVFDRDRHFGLILQYPDGAGRVSDYAVLVKQVHEAEGKVAVATDLLALTILTPPGEWGADIVVGSSQRMGVPMAYGGPHAAFLLPGRN
ncbi:glycine dehydrogenase [Geofilum rubicundum JCM 15548]|uniref:Glycine dehydrogenase n=1 Tax=Geofilum rubicundum JCM 15548 TaxID=1236989 RepID=A0A0E9LVA3_9BACT|nr:glycine dehydrogenase [Geofilum rubicundum JCM 15548]